MYWLVSGSLYTQENRRGIEECIGENNEKRGAKEQCQLRMRNYSQERNRLSLDDIYNNGFKINEYVYNPITYIQQNVHIIQA
jgi:hypothetical protein